MQPGRDDAAATTTSIEKALDVLFLLQREPGARGVTEIGRALEIPKSSVHRLLAALRRRDLVERDERGRYRPGAGLVALARGALDRDPLVAAARAVLESEASQLGETVFLVAARGGRLLVLDKVEGTGFLRAAPSIGAEVPLHATAVGKLQLAFGEGEVAWPEGALERFTPRTSSSREALAREVSRARRRGFAENLGEWISGLAVVAAPVLVGARLRGSLCLAVPAARLEELGRGALADRACAAAARIAARLEGRVA